MRRLQSFGAFIKTEENQNTAFIVEELSTDSPTLQVTFSHQKHGQVEPRDFRIPRCPRVICMANKSTHNSISIRWDMPENRTEPTSGYLVKCIGPQTTRTVETTATDFTFSYLQPNCKYDVSVQNTCRGGFSHPDTIPGIETKPTSPPIKPQAQQRGDGKINLQWLRPADISEECLNMTYKIIAQTNGSAWKEMDGKESADTSIILPVECGKKYRFKVYCDCGPLGRSRESEATEEITIENLSLNCAKTYFRKSSKLVRGGISIHQLELKKLEHPCPNGVLYFELGNSKNGVHKRKSEKVIALIGTQQSRKYSFLNQMVNFIFGLDEDDNFCFRLKKDEPNRDQNEMSDDDNISCYVIHHQDSFRIDYSLTVIDIPEFFDLGDINRTKTIRQKMYNLLSIEGKGEIKQIDALCIVGQSFPGEPLRDHILSNFGKNIEECLIFIQIVSLGQLPKSSKEEVKDVILSERYFKFNNFSYDNKSFAGTCGAKGDTGTPENLSPLFSQVESMFWSTEKEKLQEFFKELKGMGPQSIASSKEVMRNYVEIENALSTIVKEVNAALRLFDVLLYANRPKTKPERLQDIIIREIGDSEMMQKNHISTGIMEIIQKVYDKRTLSEKDMQCFQGCLHDIDQIIQQKTHMIKHAKEKMRTNDCLRPDPLLSMKCIWKLMEKEKLQRAQRRLSNIKEICKDPSYWWTNLIEKVSSKIFYPDENVSILRSTSKNTVLVRFYLCYKQMEERYSR